MMKVARSDTVTHTLEKVSPVLINSSNDRDKHIGWAK